MSVIDVANMEPEEIERMTGPVEVKFGHDYAGEHVLMLVLSDNGKKGNLFPFRADEAEEIVDLIQSELKIIRKMRSTRTN
jgi:hypothetical protein